MNEMKIQVICCTIIDLTDNMTSTSRQSDVLWSGRSHTTTPLLTS